MEFYSAIKKNKIMPFAGKMDRTGGNHVNKKDQTQKDK
jgi:hypothetical protein